MIRHVATVSLGTLASRATGFLRDAMIAALLGAGAAADIFVVPFQIVSAVRRLIGEGALNAGLVPAWLKVRETQGAVAAAEFASRVLGTLSALLALVALIVAGAVWLIASGNNFTITDAVLAAWLMLPYLACAAPVAVMLALLNAQMRFGLPAFAPLLFNLLLIAVAGALLSWLHTEPVTAALILAGTIGVAGLVQMRVLSSSEATKNVRLMLPTFEPKMREFLASALPGMIASASPQLLMLVGMAAAASQPGAVSWLYFANRLIELPLGLVGVAMGTVMVPLIARDAESALAHEKRAYEISFAIAAPACVALLVLADDIVRVLFQHGAFTAQDTQWTSFALAILALGLPIQVYIKLVSASFFGRGDTKTPMIAALLGIASTGIFSMLVADQPTLSFAFPILAGTIIQAQWLIIARWLTPTRRPTGRASAFRFVAVIAASLLMAALLHFASLFLGDSVGWAVAALKLAALIALGLGSYVLMLRAFGVVTAEEVCRALRKD